MPVLAVGAALFAVAEAAPVIGGIIAGTVEIGALSSVLAITTAVGATVGAIGAVTGDKDLAMAGFIMAGVSGIASMANSAQLFGDTSHLFSASSSSQIPNFVPITPSVGGSLGPSQFMYDTAAGTALSDASDYIKMFTPGDLTTGVVDSLGPLPDIGSGFQSGLEQGATSELQAALGPTNIPQGLQYASADTRATDAIVDGDPIRTLDKTLDPGAKWYDPNVNPYSDSQITGTTETVKPVQMGDVSPSVNYEPGVDKPAGWTTEEPLTGGETSPKSAFMDRVDRIGNYLDKHDWAGRAAVGFLEAAFDPRRGAQADQLRAQANAYNAEAAKTNQQVANLASGVPLARLKPVQRAPVTGYPTASPGIINAPAIQRI